MAKSSDDASRIICANTIRENEKRLLEAQIKNQRKDQAKQDLNKLFNKLNQAAKVSVLKALEHFGQSCYNGRIINGSYGPVSGLLPGTWWGIRMDCSRDHIHEPFDADIHEGPFGVISICTSSSNVNEDVDLGDFLTLTGQVYHEEQPNVDPLICNYKNQIPLRLIRSYNLQNDIAPNTGYRYDGLYTVIDYWIGMASDGIKYNKFALMRLTDQESPSWNSKISANLSCSQRCIPLSTRSVCPNTYALRKCSIVRKRKFTHEDDCESLPIETLKTVSLVDTSKKSIPESSIVMRHVFKKPLNNMENAISTSVPDRKILTCLGASTTKTHNTNISIRMGLYESSHNAQDARKNMSTMLHKPVKPMDIANRMLLDVESVRMPLREDSSKLPARIDMDKVPVKSAPSENISCDEQIVTDNANEIACPLNKQRRNLCSMIEPSLESSLILNTYGDANNTIDNNKKKIQDISKHSNEHKLNSTISLSSLESKLNSLNGSVRKLNSFNKSIQKLNSIDNEPVNDSIVMQDERLSKCQASSEPLCTQNIKSLDSLTPDKILNLINKEKHHPLSKMLIGNVIGLTIEEYAKLNESSTTTLDMESRKNGTSPKVSLKKRDNVKENVACLDNGRYCRYSRSKKLSWKVTKQSDTGNFNKVLPSKDRQSCNDVNKKRNGNARITGRNDVSKENKYLSPFRVQTSFQTITRHTRNSNNVKTRLRTDKGVLVKHDFSNSSIKKNRYKKRDREIANLSIDANFGPMPRGPRNRRLRCRNNTHANKECCNTVIYSSPSKRHKSTFKRKSKLTRVNHQRSRDKQVKDRYKVPNILHTNVSKDINNSMKMRKNFKVIPNNDNNSPTPTYNDSDKNERKEDGKTESKIVTIDVNDRSDNCNVSKITFDRNLRKKLARTTIPSSQRNAHEKTPVKKPNTADATTQCRLISENPEIYVIGHLDDHRAILKMEWPKFEELKAEFDIIRDNRRSRIEQSRFCRAAFTEDNVCCHKDDDVNAMQDRGSAFVPVHMFDSDLRIARLRSIGFKPIIKPFIKNDSEIVGDALVSTSKVTKRDVAEEYDKYTSNEDNNVVVYMDDELQYQDIEEEDINESALTRECRTSLLPNVLSTGSTLKSIQSRDDNIPLPETLPSRENLESPWHGWKKIVQNNRSYWIGW